MAYSHILVLHTDNGSVKKTKYVLDIVQALREAGYKVYLLTTNNSIKYINDVPFKLIFSWFPRTIFGYHKKYLFTIRSLLVALYACWNPPRNSLTEKEGSSMVICDGSPLTIPLLKYFSFRVSFIYFMVSFRRLVTHVQDVKLTSLETSCLQHADEVILPSHECQENLQCLPVKKKLVLPPCVEDCFQTLSPDQDLQLPDLSKYQHIFTVFGEYAHPENMYMVLYAFVDLKKMLFSTLFNNTRIIFVGRCETEEECYHLSKFNNMILNQDPSISEKVYLYDTSDMKSIKSFLLHSLALIDTCDSLFNVLVVQAQEMGKPVICFQGGFNQEIIIGEVTGVFVAKHIHSVRNCMHRFISGRHWVERLGIEARRNFRDKFSMCTFRESVNYFANKCKVIKYNSFLPLDSYEYFHWSRTNSQSHYDLKTCED